MRTRILHCIHFCYSSLPFAVSAQEKTNPATVPVWKIISTDTWTQCSRMIQALIFFPGTANLLKTVCSFPWEMRVSGSACPEREIINFIFLILRHNRLHFSERPRKCGQQTGRSPTRSCSRSVENSKWLDHRSGTACHSFG